MHTYYLGSGYGGRVVLPWHCRLYQSSQWVVLPKTHGPLHLSQGVQIVKILQIIHVGRDLGLLLLLGHLELCLGRWWPSWVSGSPIVRTGGSHEPRVTDRHGDLAWSDLRNDIPATALALNCCCERVCWAELKPCRVLKACCCLLGAARL